METTFDHNRHLKKIANKKLKPFGITQWGNSRTFLYDNGWWTIVIEFQPSSFSKGTYLNIGVDFNFYPRDYFAFCYGSREKGYEQANDEIHFKNIISDYCDFTITKVDELKSKFKNLSTATNTFAKSVNADPWGYFTFAILNGLTGNLSECKDYLIRVQKRKCEYSYEVERQKLVTEILSWLDNGQTFLINTKELVNQARKLKKLPIADLSSLV